MASLRKNIVDAYMDAGWILREDDIHPTTGRYRSDLRADVYRWEAFVSRTEGGPRFSHSSWQTMTEAAKNYRQGGELKVNSLREVEISPPTHNPAQGCA